MSQTVWARHLFVAVTFLFGLAGFDGAPAAPQPAAAAEAAPAAAPPGCPDEKYVRRIRAQYDDADSLREGHKITAIAEIAETHYGPSPESLNKYATATNRAVNSRYCTAKLTLDDGKADTLYWRLDYIQDGDRHSINYDHCSDRHDTFKDRCADYREGR